MRFAYKRGSATALSTVGAEADIIVDIAQLFHALSQLEWKLFFVLAADTF
jgi:hypothetical protein